MRKEEYQKRIEFLIPKEAEDKKITIAMFKGRLLSNQTRRNERIVKQLCKDKIKTMFGIPHKPHNYTL